MLLKVQKNVVENSGGTGLNNKDQKQQKFHD